MTKYRYTAARDWKRSYISSSSSALSLLETQVQAFPLHLQPRSMLGSHHCSLAVPPYPSATLPCSWLGLDFTSSSTDVFTPATRCDRGANNQALPPRACFATALLRASALASGASAFCGKYSIVVGMTSLLY